VAQAEALVPAVLELLEKAAGGVFLLPTQMRLLFYGLHALAAARRTELYRPLIRLMREPGHVLEPLFGDADTESLPPVLLSVFDGDPAPLIAAAEDVEAEGVQRWTFLSVLSRLVFDGAVPRDVVVATLRRFDAERLAPEGDAAWEGWQEAVGALRASELADRVRACWEDGRAPRSDAEKADWEDRLRQACENPSDPAPFLLDRLVAIDDPVAALAWVRPRDSADADEAESITDDFGPDPAENALDQDEIEWLDDFLASDQAGDPALSLEELDGLFCALLAGPSLLMPSAFMPEVWGTPEGVQFDSREQAEYVMQLMLRHWNAIASRLAEGYPHTPLLVEWGDETDGEEWASGFLRGMRLQVDEWERMLEDEDGHFLIGCVFLLLPPDEADVDGFEPPPAERRPKLLADLPLVLAGIASFWREHGQGVARAPVRRADKVGRNAACPCGSGKKYKRCCGAATRVVH
jgi:yecA family protein